MPLQFHQAVEHLDVWIASSADDISFVITFASPTGPGFHGRRGFFASWRSLFSRTGAIKIIGSPFETFAEAEAACDTMLGVLEGTRAASPARANDAAAHRHFKQKQGPF
jgi:hypothetical protein